MASLLFMETIDKLEFYSWAKKQSIAFENIHCGKIVGGRPINSENKSNNEWQSLSNYCCLVTICISPIIFFKETNFSTKKKFL